MAAPSPGKSRSTTWTYASAPKARRLTAGPAIALHAGQHLRRIGNLRQLWVYALIVVAVVLGNLALVRFSLSEPSAMRTYFESFVLRAQAMCALGLATAAIRADADAGALGLFLLRPCAPVALPIGRWLAVGAMVALAGLLMVLGLAATAAGTTMMVDLGVLGRMTLAVLLGGFAYAAVFLSIACWFRSAAATGLAWFAVADLVLPSLSETVGALSPSHHLQLLVQGVYPQNTSLVDRVKDLAHVTAPPVASQWNAWLVPIEVGALGLLTAVALGLALWRLRRAPPG